MTSPAPSGYVLTTSLTWIAGSTGSCLPIESIGPAPPTAPAGVIGRVPRCVRSWQLRSWLHLRRQQRRHVDRCDAGGRCLPTNTTGSVAARAVVTTTDEEHDDNQQDHDDGDDPNHLHPTWDAGGRFAVVHPAAVIAGVWRAGPVSHARVLSSSSVAPVDRLGRCPRRPGAVSRSPSADRACRPARGGRRRAVQAAAGFP